MSNDKDKLLQIMASLESDYAHGKISREKYIYFRSKYEDKLNALDAREATNRIRSMQGKPSDSPKKKRPIKNERKEEEDLVQKYIINPKKGDKQVKKSTPMDSGTFKLLAILILALGFTVGAGFGVFNFDLASFSDTNASAIVTDTAFPDVKDVSSNSTSNSTGSGNSSYTPVETTTDVPTDSGSDSQPDSSSTPTPTDSGGQGGSSSTPTPEGGGTQ